MEGNSDIIYKKEFLDSLKEPSLLEFRKNIELVQELRPSLSLEELVLQYYDELLKEYCEKTEMFQKYQNIVRHFQERDYEFLENYNAFDYLVDEKMMIHIQDLYHYRDGLEMTKDFLRRETNRRLSEIVIDGLFGDTIYNVWLNLREMVRFQKIIPESMRLREKNLNFYLTVLQIDEMNGKEKIAWYQEWKDKRIRFQFYEDLRKLKDYSYQMINDRLWKFEDQKKFFYSGLSKTWGVDVYDFRGEDFYMMVRCQKEFSGISRIRRKCYTLISSNNMEVFNLNYFIYGYQNIPSEQVLHVFEKDAYSSSGKHSNFNKFVNRIMTPQEIADTIGYSEIQLVNILNRVTGYYEELKPDYLVVFDQIKLEQIQEAKRLGIPIVRIETNKYLDKRKEYDTQQQDLKFVPYQKVLDDYTEGAYQEDTRLSRRLYRY